MYIEDRKRLIALPETEFSPPSQRSGPSSPPTWISSNISSSSVIAKPKSILVDKQCSEPNTPTSKNIDRPMVRGYSDLGQRMKKRVTLR